MGLIKQFITGGPHIVPYEFFSWGRYIIHWQKLGDIPAFAEHVADSQHVCNKMLSLEWFSVWVKPIPGFQTCRCFMMVYVCLCWVYSHYSSYSSLFLVFSENPASLSSPGRCPVAVTGSPRTTVRLYSWGASLWFSLPHLRTLAHLLRPRGPWLN